MARYTIELGKLIDSGFSVGLEKYPIFSEEYRKPLNEKIIEHFFFREIGFETPELFKRVLNRTMCEIMPYYNKLYLSELLDFNPLENYDKYEEVLKENESRQTSENSGRQTSENSTGYTSTTNNQDSETGESRTETTTESENVTHTANSGETTNNNTVTDNTQSETGHSGTVSTITESDITVENENLNVKSDTPNGMLSIGNIKNNTYASSADMGENSQTTANDTNTTQTFNNSDTTTNTGTTTTANTSETSDISDTTATAETSGNSATSYENSRTATGSESSESTGNTITENVDNSTTENSGNETITIHMHGKSEGVSYSVMLSEYRETFLNIDMLIINDLERLFMQIF